MNDKELLELAAKAAGLEVLTWNHTIPALLLIGPVAWNPLTDDGDALRLAVKLRLHVDHRQHSGVTAWAMWRYDATPFDEAGSDEYAATRRAIVRAAAAIGKEMP